MRSVSCYWDHENRELLGTTRIYWLHLGLNGHNQELLIMHGTYWLLGTAGSYTGYWARLGVKQTDGIVYPC